MLFGQPHDVGGISCPCRDGRVRIQRHHGLRIVTYGESANEAKRLAAGVQGLHGEREVIGAAGERRKEFSF